MAADRKFAGNDRLLVIGLRLERMRYAADHDLGCRGRHFAGWRDAVSEPFYEQLPVRVQHDLDDSRIIEGNAKWVPEGFLKLADKPGVRTEECHAARPIQRVQAPRGRIAGVCRRLTGQCARGSGNVDIDTPLRRIERRGTFVSGPWLRADLHLTHHPIAG